MCAVPGLPGKVKPFVDVPGLEGRALSRAARCQKKKRVNGKDGPGFFLFPEWVLEEYQSESAMNISNVLLVHEPPDGLGWLQRALEAYGINTRLIAPGFQALR